MAIYGFSLCWHAPVPKGTHLNTIYWLHSLKCDIYGLFSAIKWPFMELYTKYMVNIVIAYDALVVRGVTVKILYLWDEKSRIRETPNVSTDADSRTDSNLKRLRDLSHFFLVVS